MTCLWGWRKLLAAPKLCWIAPPHETQPRERSVPSGKTHCTCPRVDRPKLFFARGVKDPRPRNSLTALSLCHSAPRRLGPADVPWVAQARWSKRCRIQYLASASVWLCRADQPSQTTAPGHGCVLQGVVALKASLCHTNAGFSATAAASLQYSFGWSMRGEYKVNPLIFWLVSRSARVGTCPRLGGWQCLAAYCRERRLLVRFPPTCRSASAVCTEPIPTTFCALVE